MVVAAVFYTRPNYGVTREILERTAGTLRLKQAAQPTTYGLCCIGRHTTACRALRGARASRLPLPVSCLRVDFRVLGALLSTVFARAKAYISVR